MDKYEELKTIISIYNKKDNWTLFSLNYDNIVTSILQISGLIDKSQHVEQRDERIIIFTNRWWKEGDLELNCTFTDILNKFEKSNNIEEFKRQAKENLIRKIIY